MYLPQIWCIREHRESRRPLHSSHQHLQREDIHLPVVLVPGTGHHDSPHRFVQNSDHNFAKDKSNTASPEIPTYSERMHKCHHKEGSDRRLVPAIYARTEFKWHSLQGDRPRTVSKTWLPNKGIN